jgi:hypothetical protein
MSIIFGGLWYHFDTICDDTLSVQKDVFRAIVGKSVNTGQCDQFEQSKWVHNS